MFSSDHYVPILRWKRGEQIALRELYEDDKQHITPLIELVPKNGLLDKPDKIVKQFKLNWDSLNFFLDFQHVAKLFNAGFIRSLDLNFKKHNLRFIPVTGINRTDRYQNLIIQLLKDRNKEISLRIYPKEIIDTSFRNKIDAILKNYKVKPNMINLIVDLQILDENSPDFAWICNNIPYLHQWKTFIISAGSFPINLSNLEKNRQHTLPRHDWINWVQQINSIPKLPRLPTYSDYTIQYPLYSEPPFMANVSASIRYASTDYWVIMRGEGLRNPDGPGYAQYNAQALLLFHRAEYLGEQYSYGDNYIHDKAFVSEQPGTPETWLRAGFNHHITVVVRNIANQSVF